MRTGDTLFLLTPRFWGKLLDLWAVLWALTLRLNISCLEHSPSVSFSLSLSLSPPPPPLPRALISLQTTTKGVGVQGGMVKLATLKTHHRYWFSDGDVLTVNIKYYEKCQSWLKYMLIVRAVSLARWERKWASVNDLSFTTSVLTYYQPLLAAGMLY